MVFKLLRMPEVISRSGNSRSAIYLKIAGGLWTCPVKIGPRASAWPDYEVHELNAARVAGKSVSEIRVLVSKLEAARSLGQYGSAGGGR